MARPFSWAPEGGGHAGSERVEKVPKVDDDVDRFEDGACEAVRGCLRGRG